MFLEPLRITAVGPTTAAVVAVVALIGVLLSHLRGRRTKGVQIQSASTFITPKPVPLADFDLSKAEPIRYRPFKHGVHPITMGIRTLDWNQWIEMDRNFIRYHDAKCEQLGRNVDAHVKYVDDPVTVMACYEVLDELVRYLTGRYPTVFEMQGGRLANKATKEIFGLDKLTPTEALTTAAKLIQDDIILMVKNPDGHYHLDAGAVCLPGFWRLRDKFRSSLDQLHIEAHVAHYQERLQLSMNRYFEKMTPEKAIVRNNYFIQLDGDLHWSYRMGDQYGTEHATWSNADHSGLTPEGIHFRSERQTLRRLPKSGALMFTVRTYFEPMAVIGQEPHIPGRLAEAIRGWSPETAEYKGRPHWENLLLPYLDQKHQEQEASGILDKYPEAEYPL